jgi:hypothetical protein
MWTCGNCGETATRGGVTFDLKGNPVRERCQNCAPEEFDTAFRMPTDQRIYSGPDAMPNRYKLSKDGILHATDELVADTAALWEDGPTARAKTHKMKTRRTDPLTPEEIAANRRWGDEVLAPFIRAHGTAALAGVLNKEQES